MLTIGGDEFSWLLPTLGLWFASFLARDEQNRGWLAKAPATYWLTGFFNPQGFLTAVKQDVGRKHRKDAWALDDLVYHTEVTSYTDVAKVRKPPPEGVHIHGLSMDGAAWDKKERCITESQPKKLFAALPVMLVTASTHKLEVAERKRVHGAEGPYDCPVYKYAQRTDRYLIFSASLPCGESTPSFWGLRGLALVACTDY